MRLTALCLPALLLAALAAAEEPKLVEEPDAFKTLVNPDCSHCKDEAKRRNADLKPGDRVLCWVRGKYDGGAIPFRFFLNRHRVISDTYGVFVHDPDAGFARAFAPSKEFTFHGWRNGVMVIKRKDGTLYSALTGRAFAGPDEGKRLALVPTVMSEWGWWLKHYPDTVAFQMYDKYKAVDAPTKAHPSSVKSRGKADPRLPADERVLGVYEGGEARAYRVADLKKAKVLADKLGGRKVLLLYDEKAATAAAFDTRAILSLNNLELQWGRAIELEYDGDSADAPFKDKGSGFSFDITGRCVSEGKLKGYTLTWIDAVEVKWFAWAAEHPKTTIHGKE